MILVVTPHLQSDQSSEVLRRATNEDVIMVDDLRKAAALLRSESYLAVVIDQYLMETEPEASDSLMQHLGTAIPIQANLAISGAERLGREVKAALRRRGREERTARRAAVSSLQSELNGTITALLLSCELLLTTPGIPSEALEKMESAHSLVQKLRSQLALTLADPAALAEPLSG